MTVLKTFVLFVFLVAVAFDCHSQNTSTKPAHTVYFDTLCYPAPILTNRPDCSERLSELRRYYGTERVFFTGDGRQFCVIHKRYRLAHQPDTFKVAGTKNER